MTELELQQQRTGLWRLDPEKPLRTFDDAREFFDSVGFALLYPSRSVLLPSFIGAYLSSEENARDRKKAAADPRLKDALELANRLVREQVIFEVATERGRLLVSANEFPYFYALLGDRNPKKAPDEGVRGEQRLQAETFALIDKNGPSTKEELIAEVGKGISEAAMDRTIAELSQRLRVVRIPQSEGADRFDLLYKFAPDAVNQGKQVSNPEALSAIVARYLETVVAADQSQIEDFVGLVSPRSRVSEVLKALTGAGEFSYSYIGEKNLLRVSSSIKPEPKKPYVPRPKVERAERSAREGSGERGERPKRFDRPRRELGDRPRFDRAGGDRPAYSRESGDRGDRPFKPRRDFAAGEGGERRPYADRPRFEKRDRPGFRPGMKFGGKAAGEGESTTGERPKQPYQRREGGDERPRKSFGDRPFRPRDDDRGERPRKSFGDRGDRSFKRREGADGERQRRSFGERGDPPSRPYQRRDDERGERPRKSFGDRGDRPFQRSEGVDGDRPRRSFGERSDRPARPNQRRDEERGERPRKTFGDRGDRPFKRREDGDRPRRAFGDRESRPPREGGDRKPFRGSGFKKLDRPGKTGGKFGKPAFGKPKSRFGGAKGKPFGSRPRKDDSRPPRKPRSGEVGEE